LAPLVIARHAGAGAEQHTVSGHRAARRVETRLKPVGDNSRRLLFVSDIGWAPARARAVKNEIAEIPAHLIARRRFRCQLSALSP